MSCEHVLPSDMGYGLEDNPCHCESCGDAGWFISTRSNDGRDAVERCDECQMFEHDEDAAVVARKSGVNCQAKYPCYVVEAGEQRFDSVDASIACADGMLDYNRA